MTDPYVPSSTVPSDPGPTPSDLLGLFDGTCGVPAPDWRGDWNRYAAWLFAVCLRRRVQEGDAQDAVQEVLAVVGSFGRFRRTHPGSPLRPWLVRVLTNKLIDQHRGRARRPEAVQSEHLDGLAGTPALDTDSADREDPEFLPYGAILDRVRRRCAEPRTWHAFREVVLEGRAVADVAAELGIDPARVHTAKARALRRLREEIGAEAAPLRPEFDERTWSLFQESAVAGTSPGDVARRLGLKESEVNAAVARVFRRFRERLRDCSGPDEDPDALSSPVVGVAGDSAQH